MQKVKDHPNLIRDPYNHAIINTDSAGLEKAKAQKAAKLREKRQVEENTAEINSLKNQVTDIHIKLDLIMQLLESINGTTTNKHK